MKKFLTALCLGLLFAVHGYEVMLWGDMHYSRPRHLAKPEKRGERYLNYCRELEKRWDAYNPILMKECSRTGRSCDFAVHLGDMTDGHYDSVEKHVEALQTMAGELRSRWGKPIEFIKGNHENFDGPAARQGYAKGMPDGLNRFKMHQGDLYVYFNSEEPDLAFAKKALSSHPEAKQVFFFTHKPVAPCCRNKYVFELLFGNDPASRDVLLRLLADRRATIFCGHVHAMTRTVFKEPQTGRELVQISLSSIIGRQRGGAFPCEKKDKKTFFEEKFVAESFKFLKKVPVSVADFWKNSLVSWENYRPGQGFAVLKSENGKANVLLYCWSKDASPVTLDLTPQK